MLSWFFGTPVGFVFFVIAVISCFIYMARKCYEYSKPKENKEENEQGR